MIQILGLLGILNHLRDIRVIHLTSESYSKVIMELKFIYSEKATVDLSYVVTVKSTVEISQIFFTFSYEYMNFTLVTLKLYVLFFTCICKYRDSPVSAVFGSQQTTLLEKPH